jgi:glycerophosphoryl diester phosphodiesterase
VKKVGRVQRSRAILASIAASLLIIYVGNASWAFGAPGRPAIVSHLGLGEHYDERGLSLDSCKADRMLPPKHPYLENTIPALAAAFALGATSANIDIHPTSDGQFVVFHDWIVDCRTNGHGTTRELSLTALKKLDIGYRLTADHGRTYPFRGKFIGAMPSLAEMLDAFPGRPFTLVIKSNDPLEADRLVAYLQRKKVDVRRISVFGGDRPIRRLHRLLPYLRAGSQESVKACLTHYLALGWLGIMPDPCRNSIVAVPFNYRRLAWGWPNLFAKRLHAVNSELLLVGPYQQHSGKPGMNFVDTPEQLATLPSDYSGAIFTGEIDVIGPAAHARGWTR